MIYLLTSEGLSCHHSLWGYIFSLGMLEMLFCSRQAVYSEQMCTVNDIIGATCRLERENRRDRGGGAERPKVE